MMKILRKATAIIMVICMVMAGTPAVMAEEHIHTPSEDPADITYVGASCLYGGYAIINCSECGEVADIQIVDALGHDWVESDVAATCKNEGYHLKECIRAGCDEEERTNVTPKTGHTPSTDPMFDFSTTPTCTEDGERMVLCAHCGSVAVNEILPAVGHTWVDKSIPGSCLGYGQTTIQCSFCHEYQINEVIDPLGHDWIEYDVEADCDTKGYHVKECWREGCDQEIRTGYTNALGHEWIAAAVPPTCAEEGYTVRTCKRDGCDVSEITDRTSSLGHEWSVEEFSGSCIEDGYTVKTCTREGCGAVEKIITSPAPGHIPDYDNQTVMDAGSCTMSGYSIVPCSVCKDTAEILVIDPMGHDWEESDVAATCESEGYHLRKCVRPGCGEEERTNVTPKTDHTPSDDPNLIFETTPTCTEDGERMVLCAHCGAAAMEEVLPATGHDWVETNLPATCTGYGQHTIRCSYCREYQVNEAIDPMGHNWAESDVAATCESDGYHLRACVNGCGEEERTNVVPAFGHRNSDGTDAWGEPYVSTRPTVDSVGYMGKVCGICETLLEFEELPKLLDADFYVIKGELLEYTGSEREITIPGYVTAIGADAFVSAGGVSVVRIPENVTVIDEAAFNGCDGLVIHCYEGSAAEAFAIAHEIPYELLTGSLSLPGDADSSGKVNLNDVSLILKHIAMWDVDADIVAADVNDDGKVNLADVSLILKHIAMWDVELV